MSIGPSRTPPIARPGTANDVGNLERRVLALERQLNPKYVDNNDVLLRLIASPGFSGTPVDPTNYSISLEAWLFPWGASGGLHPFRGLAIGHLSVQCQFGWTPGTLGVGGLGYELVPDEDLSDFTNFNMGSYDGTYSDASDGVLHPVYAPLFGAAFRDTTGAVNPNLRPGYPITWANGDSIYEGGFIGAYAVRTEPLPDP